MSHFYGILHFCYMILPYFPSFSSPYLSECFLQTYHKSINLILALSDLFLNSFTGL